MTEATMKVLKSALKLSIKERARLATDLLSSLEKEKEQAEVDKAWEEEVKRRMLEIEKGLVNTISWQEVDKQLERNQHARRKA
jgi:putative addiction module component (TIGR02574 family)